MKRLEDNTMNDTMKTLRNFLLAAVAGFWLGAGPALASEKPVGVVTSVIPLAYVVEELGGERVKVDVLVPPGASPHTFEPVPSDLRKVSQARLLVVVGGGLDAWTDRLLGVAPRGLETVTILDAPNLKLLEGHDHHHHGEGHGHEKAAAKKDDHGHEGHDHGKEHAAKKDDHGHEGHDHGKEHAAKKDDHGHEGHDHGKEHAAKKDDHGHEGHDHGKEHAAKKDDHGHEGHDHGKEHAAKKDDHEGEAVNPHIWLDPIAVRDSVVPMVVEHLMEADPAGKDHYQERSNDFRARLTALDEQIREELGKAKSRQYVAFHDAWPYFAQRYDLEEVAVVQEFAGEEPTPREVANLVQGARAAGVQAILVEPQMSPRVAQTIAAEFGAGTVLVDPLGDPGDPARATYEKLMQFNMRAFGSALGGRN